MQALDKHNNGFKYLLAVINVFSKKVLNTSLKEKDRNGQQGIPVYFIGKSGP